MNMSLLGRGIPSSRRARTLAATAVVGLAAFACRDVTAPLRGQLSPLKSSQLNPPGLVVVWPDSMRGWAFYDDQHGVACADATLCGMVTGPAGQPAGTGSAELATSATTHGKALILGDYKGTRFDQITALTYSTYRQTADAGNNLAIALQFNVDYDLTDAAAAWQGRVVYEPYHGNGGQVVQGTWQHWDAKAGKWWGTKASVTRGGVATANPCVQATPCTWAQLLVTFPNAGVHATYGAVVLKAGSGWASFRGNVDQLTIGVEAVSTTFDFEVTAPASADPMLLVLADEGVTGAPARGDTTYARGTIVPYAFRAPADGRILRVYLDGEVVPDSGTVEMTADHALFVAFGPDMTLQPGDQELYAAIRAVLTAADPVPAFQALLDLVSRSVTEVGDAALQARMRRATRAAIDLNRDAASLRRVDDALGGRIFQVNLPLPPGGDGSSGSRSPAAPGGAMPSSARSSSMTSAIARTLDPAAFLYVNGVGNLFSDAALTSARLESLVRQDERFRDRDKFIVRFVYNRNDHTQRLEAADQLRCMSTLAEDGVQGVVDYTKCRGMNTEEMIISLIADLLELKALLGSSAVPTGPVV